MSESKESQEGTPPPKSSTVILLLGTIADTTWRMFLPVILFVIGGIVLDDQFKTDPWLALAGVLVGSGIAGMLILKQLRKVQT